MGKPDSADRIAQAMVLLAALFSGGNGIFMLADPFGWYEAIGTVKATGPANAHFLRDIGLAFLMSAGLLAYAACHLALRWAAALAGAGWLGLHGGLHIWEVTTGICAPGIFWQDAPGTLGPPLLALGGVGIHFARQRIAPFPLPRSVFVKALDRLTPNDTAYAHDLAALPGFALEKFQHFMPAAMHRHTAPADLLAMVRIGATRAEDCGPCLLIAARGALQDGVPRALVNAALAGELPQGPCANAYAFGFAVAANSPDAAALGEAIAAQHGTIVRGELALASAMVRSFPALKRGLGRAQSCAALPLKV